MIKVSVMYPTTEGARFDHDYYRNRHMPMVAELLGAACLRWTVDRGLNGGAEGVDAPYVAICHFYSESVEAYETAISPHRKQVGVDIANYTDIKPVMQVSEVVVDA